MPWEKMQRDTDKIHSDTHTRTPKYITYAYSEACSRAHSQAVANSVSSLESLPKALICNFSSAGQAPAPRLVNHPDELSALKQPLA